MMIRFESCQEPHFVENQGREVLKIRSLGRNMQAYRIFRAHSTDDKEKEKRQDRKKEGSILAFYSRTQRCCTGPEIFSLSRATHVWKLAFDVLSSSISLPDHRLDFPSNI